MVAWIVVNPLSRPGQSDTLLEISGDMYTLYWAYLRGQTVKNPPASPGALPTGLAIRELPSAAGRLTPAPQSLLHSTAPHRMPFMALTVLVTPSGLRRLPLLIWTLPTPSASPLTHLKMG